VTRLALLRVAALPFETLAALRTEDLAGGVEAVLGADVAIEHDALEISDLLFEAAGRPQEDATHARGRFAVLKIRRAIHNGKAPHEGELEGARAILPASTVERVEHFTKLLERRADVLQIYAAVFRESLDRGREALVRMSMEALVEHGIYLASRSLVPRVRRLARVDPGSFSHDERHTAAKLAAYLARFAAKTSPNGVFCSVALARIEGHSATVGGSGEISRVEILLNLAEVRKVVACLAVDPLAAPAIVPRPNPTLRLRDGVWTYWKPASPRNPADDEVLSRVKDQPLLRGFLEEAGRGVHDATTLEAAVAARIGHPVEELRGFYTRLVENAILIGEVEIPYSSRRRFRDLAAAARSAGCGVDWATSLENIENAVDGLPHLTLGDRTEAMETIVEKVKALPRVRPFKADELFRVDAASAFEVQLPDSVLAELTRGVRVLVRLLAAMYPEAIEQRRLVTRFLHDYPPDTDVEFLDLYRGFAEPNERDARLSSEFPAPTAIPPVDRLEAEAWAAARRIFDYFVRRAEDSAPGEIVEIDEPTSRSLAGDRPEPRWAAGALFQIAARSGAEIEAGHAPLVLNALFNGIGLALSRFAQLLGGGRDGPDNVVIAELRRAWSDMERPGAVLAEITFNHEARTANAGLRPALFPHEIELPGDLVSTNAERIPLTDLSIRYDSRSERLVLRSVSRDVEVIPVLSSGVSPSGIVSELIHIGRQGWQTVGYLPGFHAPHVNRWPRIVCGNVVLFRARWTIAGTRLPTLTRGGVPLGDAEFFLELARWQSRNGLPQRVFVHTQAEPKPFYVDLTSPVLADLLRRAVAKAMSEGDAVLHVTEMLPGPEELWVRDERGSYATEFLVQLGGPENSSYARNIR
jgi:hypothetical protein